MYPFYKPSITARQYDPPLNYFSYPFPTPHPALSPANYNNNYLYTTRNKVYNTLLKDQIQELEDALYEKRTMKKQEILKKVQSLSQLEPVKSEKTDFSSEALKILGKQQEMLGDMIKNIQSQPRFYLPPNGFEYGYSPRPQNSNEKHLETITERPIEKPTSTISKDQILKDLEIESDNDEFETQNGHTSFNKITDEEKAKIYDRMQAERSFRKKEEIRKNIKGIRRFRSLVWAILFPIFTYSVMMKRKGTMKNEYIRDMKESIDIYLEVASLWVLKSARDPIFSTINDQALDLTVDARDLWFNKGRPDALNTKKLKIHVRIRGIFQGFIQNTNRKDFPKPLMMFIDRFINNGAFIPQSYFVPYERSRLEFDKFNALCSQSEDRKSMLIAFFFVSRILVGMYLLRPIEHKLPVRRNAMTLRNLNVIGSLVELMVLMKFVGTSRMPQDAVVDENEILNRKKGYKLSARNDDKISNELLTVSEMSVFYKEFSEQFDSSQELMTKWIDSLIRLCSNARYG